LKKVTVIGSGFSSLAAATILAAKGLDVTVVEKNSEIGGRARKFEAQGFMFDMGPSWYWMPDVFENYFALFGKSPKDYYELKRLDPSYRVFFEDEIIDMPADLNELTELFEKREKGAGKQLMRFLEDASVKYDAGMKDLVFKPGESLLEFANWKVFKGVFSLDLFSNFHDCARKYFKDPKLLSIIEFPVLFLGAMPRKTPALYSLMNYADIKLGTWYPMGGMHKIVEAMQELALEKGVKFRLGESVEHIEENGGMNVTTSSGQIKSDYVVGGADYHHIETQLLRAEDQQYDAKYWDSRVMAPSCLLYYVGIGKEVEGLNHHNLFFDAPFDQHSEEIYETKQWPKNPLFYVCCPSKTDDSVAPKGYENLFILIPIAAGIEGDTEKVRGEYFQKVITRIEKKTGTSISNDIVYKRSYCLKDFQSDYNAFRGNAYGLANTLRQTAILKPRLRHKKLRNLFYTGQLTTPGPGMPPSLISGQVAANEILKDIKRNS
jgi:phytoene desaturase